MPDLVTHEFRIEAELATSLVAVAGFGVARARRERGHGRIYYFGRCECGWRGQNRTSPLRARDDAKRHAIKAMLERS